MRNYDLVVLGSGTAGGDVAELCRQAGWRVAIVETTLVGGTCALRGCEAKKPFTYAALGADWARRLQCRGLVGNPALAWGETVQFKRRFTLPVPERERRRLHELGIELFDGLPEFVDPETLRVGGTQLRSRTL